MKVSNPIPRTKKAWLTEIAAAYRDACNTIPFVGVEQPMSDADLFHLGPIICLKFRGMTASKTRLKRATEAALTSYMATESSAPDLLRVPQMAFAFAYVTSHLGLDLVDQEKAADILDHVEANLGVFESWRPTR